MYRFDRLPYAGLSMRISLRIHSAEGEAGPKKCVCGSKVQTINLTVLLYWTELNVGGNQAPPAPLPPF